MEVDNSQDTFRTNEMLYGLSSVAGLSEFDVFAAPALPALSSEERIKEIDIDLGKWKLAKKKLCDSDNDGELIGILELMERLKEERKASTLLETDIGKLPPRSPPPKLTPLHRDFSRDSQSSMLGRLA